MILSLFFITLIKYIKGVGIELSQTQSGQLKRKVTCGMMKMTKNKTKLGAIMHCNIDKAAITLLDILRSSRKT